jgi:hypothetical protein
VQRLRTGLSIASVVLIAATVHAKTYELPDLDALEKQSSWQELLDHAEDIVPSQRNAHWAQLVEEAGTGVLAGLDTDKVSFTGLGAADELTRRYPQLKKSKAFMAKRAELGLRAFARCFELTDDSTSGVKACAERLAGFSDGDPDNVDLSRRAISLIDHHVRYHTAAAFSIYYRLIGKKKGAKECSNDGAKWAVIEALALDKADPRVAQAREVAQATCWDQMQDQIVDALTTPHDGAHYFENSCGFLVEKKALASLQTDRCKALPK